MPDDGPDFDAMRKEHRAIRDAVKINITHMAVRESYRRGLPLWRRWHWHCMACGLTDAWGYRTQRQVKLAMVAHIGGLHSTTAAAVTRAVGAIMNGTEGDFLRTYAGERARRLGG